MKECAARAARLFYSNSTNQIIVFVVAVASSLLPIVSTLNACDREVYSNYPEIRSLSAVWRSRRPHGTIVKQVMARDGKSENGCLKNEKTREQSEQNSCCFLLLNMQIS